MSANITLKSQDLNNDWQTVEVFLTNGGIVFHRHALTSNETKAKMYGIVRKFWNKWYCKQELILTVDELKMLTETAAEHADEFRDILFGEEEDNKTI